MTSKPEKLGINAQCFGSTISDYGWSHGRYNPLENPDQLGLEIEFEGVPEGGLVFNAPKGWAFHNDGSLRGGSELVSAGPRTIEQVDEDLDRVITTFKNNDFVPVFSFRTSLHVHVNVNDLTHLQLLNMFALYTIFEQPMLEMGGEERVGNVHCMPVFLAQYPIEELRRGLNGEVNKYGKSSLDNSLRNLMRNDMRYSSFNWAAVSKFGTIEYRSHRGTLDKDTIMRWCRLILRLKAVAKTYDNPLQIVQDFSRYGPLVFAQRTLPDAGVMNALCAKDVTRLWEGLRNVQMFAFATDDWRPYVAKAKKETAPQGYVINDAGGWGQAQPIVEGAVNARVPVDWAQFVPAADGLRDPAVDAALQELRARDVARRARNRIIVDDQF